jgi:ABC-2 type transport system ATP-binding protein
MTLPVTVEASDLTKRFGNVAAVDGVSFAVHQGEIFAFLGANGSGKTTTIRMLCGLLIPTGGSGRVLGLDIAREGDRIRRQLGYMSQKFALYEDLTVRENLAFYAGIYGVGRRAATRIAEVLALIDLTDHAADLTAALSTGWRQRLALGCAILHHPRVLFLDEPTAGVDPLARRQFWDLIYALAAEGVTVFVTTHYMDEAEQADRISLMRAGRLIAVDTPDGLKAQVPAGTLWEIDVDQPLTALTALQALPEVVEVTLHGVLLHVRTDGRPTDADLTATLDAAGLPPRAVQSIPATLEDVFIALAGPRLPDA